MDENPNTEPLTLSVAHGGLDRMEHLQKLVAAALAIHAATSLQDILHVVSDHARAVLDAQRAVTTFLVDGDWASAQRAVSLADPHAPREPTAPFMYAPRVAQTNRPLRLSQAELEAHTDTRGWLGAPLVGRDGKNAGLVEVANKAHGEFDDADLHLLTQLAQMASVAIANARLYEIVRNGRARMQALSKQLLAVQENERRALARELHDEVGQMLTGLQLSLEMVSRLPREASLQKLEEAQTIVNDLIQRVREMSLNMRPSVLDDLGLLPALLWHFGRFHSQTQVRVQFQHSGIEARRFPSEIEIAVYRIVQEALTNVARHARVSEAAVRLWADQNSIVVQIADRGRGFDPSQLRAGSSSGVSGIRERAYMLGGLPTIESKLETGTTITVELPLRNTLERRGSERFDSAGR